MYNFKLLANTPIFRRLFYAFLVAALIPGIIIIVLSTSFINTLDTRSQAVQTGNAAIEKVTVGLNDLQGMNSNFIALHFGNTGGMAGTLTSEITQQQQGFTQALTDYQSNYQISTSSNMDPIHSILLNNDPTDAIAKDQSNTLAKISTEWLQYKQALQQALTAPQKAAFLTQVQNSYTPLNKDWQHLVSVTENVSSIVAQVDTSETQPIILVTVIAFLGTLLVVVTIGYIVILTITRPLSQLTNLTRRIAKGDTNARATIAGRDEIYMVANSMNAMLDNIVRLIQETQAQRDNLQSQVEKLVSEVSGVGEGDLRVQAEVTADALGVLADSFNYMVEELGSLIVRVKMVANEVENSTATILDRMTQLVETGDVQIQQISAAAVEVEHMADSSRQVADRAQTLYQVARDARVNAQGGRDAVQQTIEGMGRIHENVQITAGKVQTLGERSREINNIVEGISTIAHQTNRLALDAAIQAAMAGENGKGFGAVAADIRRLAERAKDQASSIARIVRSVREDIGAAAVSMQDTERETSAGAKLTEEAGVALESIFTAVEYQAREIETINQAATQQLQSSSAIVQIMHGISESTHESSMSTRDASQNMERLARLVEQLRSSVEAFKLRENQGYYVPSSNINVTPEEEQDNQLTVSGIFRTVSATSLPSGQGQAAQPALPQGRSSSPFSYFPTTPNPQNSNGGWDMPPDQQWPEDTYNGHEQPINGNGNGGWNR
ncbi:MAG: methyl-accepting chemotaxis protein [Ktedonobacteraceae bacterium]